MSHTPKSEQAVPAASRRSKAVGISVVAILLAGAVFKGYSSMQYSKTHVATDDAYVTGDLMNVSPTVPGTLVELNIQDGQFVHKGDRIAKLDTSGPETDVEQAEANLRAMETQVPQAESAYEFERLSTDAAIKGSDAALASQSARTEGSGLQVQLTRDTVTSQIRGACAQLEAAKAQALEASAGVETARDAVASAQQAIETAQRQAGAAGGGVNAAEANSEKLKKDLDRYTKLAATDAITRQQFDAATAASKSADAALITAQEQEAAARSQVGLSRRALIQAQSLLVVSERKADTAKAQIRVAEAAVQLAASNRTNVQISGTNEESNQGMVSQATAALSGSQARTQEVDVRLKQIATAKAQVQQSKAVLDRAKIHLRDCILVSPCDGYVVRRMVNVGTTVNPGQTVATITRGAEVWVMANFKETEVGNVVEGQPAVFDVDAFPGKKFKGAVIHVLRATGSATTLLPPDNSTGNFTKVVQRVPVKLSIKPLSALDFDVLRQGMSVTTVIDTGTSGRS